MSVKSNLFNVESIPSDLTLSPLTEENYWTQSRLELRSWFKRNAPSLGELYEGAVRMAFSSEFPGRTRFVAHAVREIRNRLPDVISGSKIGGLFDWKNKLDQLVKEWQKSGFTLDETMPHEVIDGQVVPEANILIDPQLFRKIKTLLKDHIEARERPIDSAIRLYEGIAPDRQNILDTMRPVVNQWLIVTDWFVRKAHDSGARDIDIDAETLLRNFEVFEITLEALIRDFFRTVEGLDEILEDANS